MISVALASYNGEKYIIQQLASILNQTVPVDEVIISDDCSTDHTVDVVTDFINLNKLNNWKIVVNETNIGFSSNFFNAVKRTCGDIVFIADQDDIWDRHKVEIMSAAMRSDNDIYLVSSKSGFINGNNDSITGQGVNPGTATNDTEISIFPFSHFICSSNIPGCSMCIRKEIRNFLSSHNELPLDKSLGHDWYFSMVAASMGRFVRLNRSLFSRRIHETNASLGRLRKKTIIVSNNEKRNSGFEQIISAHEFIINNEFLSKILSTRDIDKIKSMIAFFKMRLRFTTSSNIFIWAFLLFSLDKYYQCTKNIKFALKLYIADLLYAFNINWKLGIKLPS